MTSRHYDVVVIGRSIGALTAAVLLARRDFRTLVIGQGQKRADVEALYDAEEYRPTIRHVDGKPMFLY